VIILFIQRLNIETRFLQWNGNRTKWKIARLKKLKVDFALSTSRETQADKLKEKKKKEKKSLRDKFHTILIGVVAEPEKV